MRCVHIALMLSSVVAVFSHATDELSSASWLEALVDGAEEEVAERSRRNVEGCPGCFDVRKSGSLFHKIYSATAKEKRYAHPHQVIQNVARKIRKRFAGQIDDSALNDWISQLDILDKEGEVNKKRKKRATCPYKLAKPCDKNAVYRRFDGSCNNLKHPLWGKVFTPFKRLMDPVYFVDFLTYASDQPRRGVGGAELPSPRLVSAKLHKKSVPRFIGAKNSASSLSMYFGQFINHDISDTASSSLENPGNKKETPIICGNEDCKGGDNPECFPIPVPGDEKSESFKRFTCIPFTRSKGVMPLNCKSDKREQLNAVTHWLDASPVYGSSEETKKKLIDNTVTPTALRGALLKVSQPQGAKRNYLPLDKTQKCGNVQCSMAGDRRVDMEAGLTVVHTLMLREHNRIARALYKLNSGLKGESLFQLTRKIIIAIIQHITYKEYLPMIYGSKPFPGTELKKTGYFTGYNANVDPRISNVFAAAANRMGHSQIMSRVWRFKTDFSDRAQPEIWMNETWFDPETLHHDGLTLGNYIAGFPVQVEYEVDIHFTDKITEFLFTDHPKDEELPDFADLVSINIQRARDHGIAGYPAWRKFCKLPVPKSFDDLASNQYFGSKEIADKFKAVYSDVKDIDLLSAGVAEKHVGDGLLGPTFRCLLGMQYRSLREGDRFWYENDGKEGFTPQQLAEIRKVTFSKIICNNEDFAEYFIKAFKIPTPDNKKVPCSKIPDLDLKVFAFTY